MSKTKMIMTLLKEVHVVFEFDGEDLGMKIDDKLYWFNEIQIQNLEEYLQDRKVDDEEEEDEGDNKS